MGHISYKLASKKLAVGKDAGLSKYYAISSYKGEVTLDDLTDKISRYSTLSRVDIISVLTALVDEVGEGLENGKIVRLGELGSFRLILNSEGVDNKEDFRPSMIKKTKVNFNPGKRIKRVQERLKFKEV